MARQRVLARGNLTSPVSFTGAPVRRGKLGADMGLSSRSRHTFLAVPFAIAGPLLFAAFRVARRATHPGFIAF